MEGTECWASKPNWNNNYLNEINREEGNNILQRTIFRQHQDNHENGQTAKGIH
jgi:hypothetical protein